MAGVMSINEAVKRWGISKSMLARLCREGRIAGAEKVKGVWTIPVDAQYPADARLKSLTVSDLPAQKRPLLPLPVGISDYRKASSKYYYIDKTLMIRDFLDEVPMVSLFTRPRRFGKTLNMDMLRTFFEKTDEDTSVYFRDKKIWRCSEEYRAHQGKYPVVFLSFKDVKCKTWEETYDLISKLILMEYKRHDELASETNPDFDFYQKIVQDKATENDFMLSLMMLSKMLHEYHGVEPMIIIDEYDTPIQQGHSCGFYDDVVLFIENGYSIVENPQVHSGKSYGQWIGEQKKPSHRELLRLAIDHAMEQKPKSFDDVLALLHDAGYEIKPGKNPSFRGEGQKRFVRLDTLGEDYTKEVLIAVLTGEKKHTPHRQSAKVMPQKPNLLIDIQQKLQQGKGAGYERWAKVFNLKQMAQSMNYLQEHGLMEMDALVQKSDEAVEKYHELTKQIKRIEKRMDEISVLRGHILTYIKTRDVYIAYREAGYSKKFYAEHEADIIRHKATKKAFDELGLQKLPTIRVLQNEYATLLEEKKKALPEYRKARDEMRELLTVKANVEKILGFEKHKERNVQNLE